MQDQLQHKGSFSSKRITLGLMLVAFLFSFSSIIMLPYVEELSFTSTTTPKAYFLFIYMGLEAILIFLLPVILFGLCFRGSRFISFFILAFIPLHFYTTSIGISRSKDVRMIEMNKFVERSKNLIQAIQKYTSEKDHPPEKLEDLIPDYLKVVPETGMVCYPNYRYENNTSTPQEYPGNSWVLYVSTPNLFINFDRIIYLPNQNYEDMEINYALKKVGDWAYHFE